jgi:hypothetical protein
MNQVIFIKFINFPSLNISSASLILETEKLASFFKFKIKKIIHELNGALIEINSYHLPILTQNTNIEIFYEEDFYNSNSALNLTKCLNYNNYKKLIKYKY